MSGLLYCPDRDTDCMEMYIGKGKCRAQRCPLDDPEYIKKEEEKARRRDELLHLEHKRQVDERVAAKKIRCQTQAVWHSLQEEIEKKRNRMERYYTKGWTRAADNISLELAELERRQKANDM